MNYYRQLCDLPKIPAKFINDLLVVFQQAHSDDTSKHPVPEYESRKIINLHPDSDIVSARSKRYDTADDFKLWVSDHVAASWTECSASITKSGPGGIHGAHTDWSRHWALIYVIQSGGQECQTVWYKEKDQPVIRSDLGCFVNDYSLLQTLDHVIMHENAWYVIDTKCLHGVENIEHDRLTVQIGLQHLDAVKSLTIQGESL